MCVDMRDRINIQAELKNESYSFQTEKLCWEGGKNKKHEEQSRNKYQRKKKHSVLLQWSMKRFAKPDSESPV